MDFADRFLPLILRTEPEELIHCALSCYGIFGLLNAMNSSARQLLHGIIWKSTVELMAGGWKEHCWHCVPVATLLPFSYRSGRLVWRGRGTKNWLLEDCCLEG
jgi:hypothetical protein